MKVLMINGIYGSRSSGRSLSEIRDCLISSGDEVFVATPIGMNMYDYHFIRIGNALDHKIHAFLSRLTGLQAYFSKLSTIQFLRKIENIKPDIVHVQVVHGNYIQFYYLLDFLARKKIPSVFVLDDCWYFTGKCCHYTAEKCYRWRAGCGQCPRIHNDNPSWFFDFSPKMLEDKKKAFKRLERYAIVAVSDWLMHEAEQTFHKQSARITRIYNSVDLETFRYMQESVELKENLGLGSKHIVLGVATAWEDKNGLSKGIQLFCELAEKLDENYAIVLVGRQAKNVKLPNKIMSISFVETPSKLAEYYSMADVFVQMSSEETFGKVTAEALSCGTPVIVFNTTANPELVGPGCGYVVDDKKVEQVEDRVKKIVQVGKCYYKDSCRKYAEESFDSVKNANKYRSLYKELLESKQWP